jgi:glycosyltransferase involved in cell wall biosynthesis
MRIGIDARAAAEERGGRGTMVRELLLALERLAPPHTFELVARTRWAAPLGDRFTWRLIDRPDPWWNVLAGAGAGRRCDAFLSTNSYLTAWFTRVPTAMIVCDLVAYHDEYSPQRRAKVIERATLPLAVRRAEAITAISQATADDLTARFPRALAKTTVTPLAADARYASAAPDPAALERHGLRSPYVLAVGTLEPRKNLPRLIEAFAALPAELRDGHELALVGGGGWEMEETMRSIAGHAGLVRRLGHVPDADLPALYAGAALFAYPSLYEGFGLPVLEAMAAGTPVLTSDVSSLPEVAGDAALLVDPEDAGAIGDALTRLVEDRELADRLRRQGRLRASHYTWERTAELTVEAYREALGSQGPG